MHGQKSFDVAIVGSSFSGAILAWILAKAGRQVLILDRASHPRFAIGESSTPLADMLLEQIADQFGISKLHAMSRWGSWQSQIPSVGAGMKRGFSYFKHSKGTPFQETAKHENSLLVAASATDDLSDTHWLRSDVDRWLIENAIAEGVTLVDGFELRGVSADSEYWAIHGECNGVKEIFSANCIVDSTGKSAALARLLGAEDCSSQLQVCNSAIFGHFEGVGSFDSWLSENSPASKPFPFPSDNAAQHHLTEEGWFWMLRFKSNLTSVGFVECPAQTVGVPSQDSTIGRWKKLLESYPSIADVMQGAQLVNPMESGKPVLGCIPRISQLWRITGSQLQSGPPWCMLANTVGIVDPLHSTGIAHGLSGVWRTANAILSSANNAQLKARFVSINEQMYAEILWIDEVIQLCYDAKESGFEMFVAACCVYFLSAIHCERQLATTGEMQNGLFAKDNSLWRTVVRDFHAQVRASRTDTNSRAKQRIIDEFTKAIEPWNDVGLLDSALRNRISRSVAPKA